MKRFCLTVLLVILGCCAVAAEKSDAVVYINGSKFYIHTVQPGETLYGLSKLYDVGEKIILENNPTITAGLKTASSIKIPFRAQMTEPMSNKQLRKTFDNHFIAKGETLYSISRQYQISIQTILDDNPNLDPIHLRLGDQIRIRKQEIGSEDERGSKAQWEEYRNQLNKVSDQGRAYHIVQAGETLYSLSHRFGISEQELSALNGGLKATELKAGAMIQVPASEQTQQPETEEVATGTDHLLPDSTTTEPTAETVRIPFRALRPSEPLNVALMLPLAVSDDANTNYLEFYQGFLLGLDSVKNTQGVCVNVTLYNTGRNKEKMREILASDAFAHTNLIVGPVYEEELLPVIRFAEQQQIPVVTPLAQIAHVNSNVLFQLAPDPASKYAKVANLIGSDKHITLIYSGNTDKDFEQEILALLKEVPFSKQTYKYTHPTSGSQSIDPASNLTTLLANGDDNLFIIMANNEVDVDRVLAAIASADTSLSSRGNTPARFVILGNARWNRYNNIDRTMFFKDRVVFLSTYHAKRDSQAVVDFDSAYIRAFGSLPTLYSYRGYDAAAIFCPAMYNDIEYDMTQRRYTPLQTSYVFGQSAGGDNHVNHNWTRVNYNNDFTITIE
ncbi:MAG: LysM peptidoglycan-binding domain-containing protein [Alistipes sp.]